MHARGALASTARPGRLVAALLALILSLALGPACAADLPALTGRVVDQAG